MAKSVTTFLMFEGLAEEAMNLYTSIFPNSRIVEMAKYGPGEMGAEGKVKLARFTVAGRDLMAIDSPTEHAFSFTPAISLFVDCESREELESAYAALMEGGSAMMPLDNYGFSQAFAWVGDRYGVSWQLNLPSA